MERKVSWAIVVVICITLQFFIFSAIPVGAAGPETVKIGMLTAISGMGAGIGEPMVKGTQLAVNIINEEGGILGKRVELLVRDTELKPAVALRMARELYNEQGVTLFSGILSSAVALALKSVMEDQNTLLMHTTAASPKITGSQFSRNVFRIADQTQTRNIALANIMHQRFPHIKKWASICPDYEYGHVTWEIFSTTLKKLDPKVEIVAERWPPLGGTGGCGPHITAILQAQPDGLYSTLYAADMIAFIREGKQWGLFDKVKIFTGMHLDWDISVALKNEMVPMWTMEHYLETAFDNPESKRFSTRFIKAYGEDYYHASKGHAEPSYDAVFAYKAAIEKAKSFKVDDIRKALEGLTLDTPLGKKWIRPGDHQSYHALPFFQYVLDPKGRYGWTIKNIEVLDSKKYMLPVEEALKQ